MILPCKQRTVLHHLVYLTTGLGNVLVYDFAVAIPKPFISGVACEWAAPGKTMTLTGQYFYPFVDSNSFNVTFPGGVAAEVVEFSETSLTVTVPDCQMEGATISSSILLFNDKLSFIKIYKLLCQNI